MEIHLNLPQYLREWFLNQCGEECGISAVGEFPRASVERAILSMALRPLRPGEAPQIRCPEGWTRVRVPVFRGLNLESRNYLPDSGRIALETSIRSRFDADLWTTVRDMDYKILPMKNTLELWMESRGIAITDSNWQAVVKRAQRIRQRWKSTLRQRASRLRKAGKGQS